MGRFTRTNAKCDNCSDGRLLASTEDDVNWIVECDDCSFILDEAFSDEEEALRRCADFQIVSYEE